MLGWAVFAAIVVAGLTADLALHRGRSAMSLRTAAGWTAAWVALGLAFGLFVLAWSGPTPAGEYFAGYLVEWSLSVDNVFVFAVLFSYFGVPEELRHRVLFWGILGALAFRALFIVLGVELLERFAWTTYSLGVFVVAAGIWMFLRHDGVAVERHPVMRLVRSLVPVTDGYRGDHFVVNEHGSRAATPLLLLLLVIATTDVAFAVDSIPAVLAITSNGFVVLASNAFAVLGLRSLYFCVAGAMGRFAYLRAGLGAVLVFVGAKLLLADPLGEVPIGISLAVIVAVIAGAVVASEAAARGGRRPVSSLRGRRSAGRPMHSVRR